MLPRSARLRGSADFRRIVRQGVKVGRSTVIVHASHAPSIGPETPVRVGFVVSRAVGAAVTRNRVKRRLRHLAAARLADTPPGVDLVVRALPRAATAPAQLPVDLDAAWSGAVGRLVRS